MKKIKVITLVTMVVIILILKVVIMDRNEIRKEDDFEEVSQVKEANVSKSPYVSLVARENQSYVSNLDEPGIIKEKIKVKTPENNQIDDQDLLEEKVLDIVEVNFEDKIKDDGDEVIVDENADEVGDEPVDIETSEDASEEIIPDEIIPDILDESLEEHNDSEVESGSDENEINMMNLKTVDGINHYYNPGGIYLGTEKVKVIDVSHHQGVIDWDKFANEADVYGVILRIGYWKTLDRQFVNNINAIKRLNIPYGIYVYSYASTEAGAKTEADFTNKIIKEYDLKPFLGIYYDLESWNTGNDSSDGISKKDYDNIVRTYVDTVKSSLNNDYKVGVYSGRWYAMNRFGVIAKSYVDWVAEYNSQCKYDGDYSLWQYTSSGSVPGITGRVDISYIK